jgi:hypothetical protein
MKYVLASIAMALSLAAQAETGSWVSKDGRPVPNSDSMKSINGFGGSLLVTPDPDWEEKWNSSPETVPYFSEAKDVSYGEQLTILVFFINPKTDSYGAVNVRCDIKVTRPDGSTSVDERDVQCADGKLQGNPRNVRLTSAVIKYVGEEGDPPGKWVVEVSLTDQVRETAVPLKTQFTLQMKANTQEGAKPTFAFESVTSLNEMLSLVRSKLPLRSSRADVRRTFVDEGRATLKSQPDNSSTEKYLYDIDLCHYYIWRWNISADFDADNQVRQVYVNGEPVFADGNQKRKVSQNPDGKKASIYKMQRPRPEAYKGEASLGFVLLDADSDLKTTDDQVLMGAGPSRPNPVNMGSMFAYAEVDPWRSIFDSDSADRIVPYQGDCNQVDKQMEAQK